MSSSYIGRSVDAIDNISSLDVLTFNGSLQTFNLTQNSVAFVPVSADALQIQIDGVIQSGNYTVSGSTVTFDFTPSGSSVCNGIRHFGVGLLTTVSDSSITTAKLGADSVNGSKIADDSISDEHLDNTAITGQTAITSLADTDKFLVSQASDSGNLKYVEKQYLPSGGLVKLAQAKGTSAVTNIVHDSIFSTTYDFYKIIGYTNASAINGDLRFRFRSGGSEINGSYYRGGGQGWQQGASSSLTNTTFVPRYNESKFDLIDSINSNNNFGEFFEITLGGMLDRDEGLCATLRMEVNQMISNGHYRQYHYGGFYANQGANEDYDGFMLFYSNANVQYYSYAVYGIIK